MHGGMLGKPMQMWLEDMKAFEAKEADESIIQRHHPPSSRSDATPGPSSSSKKGSRSSRFDLGQQGGVDGRNEMVEWLSNPTRIKRDEFHLLCARYIVSCCLPFNHCSQDGFKVIILGILKPRIFYKKWGLTFPSGPVIAARVKQLYLRDKEAVVTEMKRARYVCTTADIWTGFKRGYMGVTAHWIEPDTLSRKCAVLSFR